MHHRIDTILERLRQDVARRLAPKSIEAACKTAGRVGEIHPQSRRERPPVRNPDPAWEHAPGTRCVPRGGLFTGEPYRMARGLPPPAVFQAVPGGLGKPSTGGAARIFTSRGVWWISILDI